jgi:hypothetical protein
MDVIIGGEPSTIGVPFVNGYCPTCKYRCVACKKLKGAIRRWMSIEQAEICSCGVTGTLMGISLP